MQLSIIIVNYNVKHFLEQCLHSVYNAIKGLKAETIVVDNNSSDGSLEYLKPQFPWVQFVENKHNVGFGKANNQALALARGQYVLFLNPDTLLPEDCFDACIDFMEQHADAGALGIRMVDGAGKFLRESKRAFPSPLTSLFKLSGLSSLFPRSRVFARYHLGYLHEHSHHEVDVLAGAFMLVRKAVLDKIGAFDEMFFMYGEDVDLSYRIQNAGWKNYYFAGSSIIHFKGESSRKGSLNYVRMFYQAMSLFVNKHYGGSRARVFQFFIQLAILLRAALSLLARFVKWIGLPLIDMALTLASLAAMLWFWQEFVKPGIQYRVEVLWILLPLFTLTFVVAGAVAGLYDRWYRARHGWLAMMMAIVVNLALYSLLNETMRFSRGVILFGGLLASVVIWLFRKILTGSGVLEPAGESKEYRQTLVAAGAADYPSALLLMRQAGLHHRVLGRINPQEKDQNSIGSFANMHGLLLSLPARELVFCMGEGLSMKAAIEFIQQEKTQLRYRFFYSHSHSMVGSDSKDTSGEAFDAGERFSIASPVGMRVKRTIDVGSCLFLLIGFPFHLLLMKHSRYLLRNCCLVLTGRKTWVGYCKEEKSLPCLKPSVISCQLQKGQMPLEPELLNTIDFDYAKNYDDWTDIKLMIKNYDWLGQ